MTTNSIATPIANSIETDIEEILTSHGAYEAVAAVMECLVVTQGGSRQAAIAKLVRWMRDTANDWQG